MPISLTPGDAIATVPCRSEASGNHSGLVPTLSLRIQWPCVASASAEPLCLHWQCPWQHLFSQHWVPLASAFFTVSRREGLLVGRQSAGGFSCSKSILFHPPLNQAWIKREASLKTLYPALYSSSPQPQSHILDISSRMCFLFPTNTFQPEPLRFCKLFHLVAGTVLSWLGNAETQP